MYAKFIVIFSIWYR